MGIDVARPNLLRHRKFLRLVHMLAIPRPHVLGLLEMLWTSAYESGSELIGDRVDVELATEWSGEKGALAEALIAAGFVDETEGVCSVHDLWDHAPDYVETRAKREAERRLKGESIASLRSEAGKRGAKVRWDGKRMANEDGCQDPDGKRMANVPTPAPAPAPIPEKDRDPPLPPAGGCGPVGPDVAPSEPSSSPPPRKRTRTPPDIPAESVDAVADAWAEACPANPQPERPLAKGIREGVTAALRRQRDPGWWAAYFRDRIATSAYLTGRVNGWRADLLWAIGPKNESKVMAGAYVDRVPSNGATNATGKSRAEANAEQRVAERKAGWDRAFEELGIPR